VAHASKLIGSAPVLLVADVVKAANYYRDQLGFTYDRFWGEPPSFCMVKRDTFVVMLAQAPADARLVPHWRVVDKMWNAYFWCDDVEALHAEFVRRGARIDYGLGIKPYGIKEFGIQDLDGHDIAFGQHL
jgi:hypothetical protein